jgi:hypothetical protein
MFLRRCAWHPRYRGRRLIYGISSWRGGGIRFTDGVCRSCAARLRRDLGDAGEPIEPLVRRIAAPGVPETVARAALAVLALAGIVFAARAVHQAVPGRPRIASRAVPIVGRAPLPESPRSLPASPRPVKHRAPAA